MNDGNRFLYLQKAVDASISQASASGCPSPNSSPSSSKNPSPRSFSPMHRKGSQLINFNR